MQEAQPSSPSFPNQSPLGAKQTKRGCNCKNSRCLKLYCECFSLGEYCSNCNCANCHNNSSSEVSSSQNFRKEAIQGILERNPQAFRPKISPFSPLSYSKDSTRHSKGCACKRTGCLKKYCECYQAGISCSDMCKCIECKNDFKTDDRYNELPVKRIIFKTETSLPNLDLVKGFVDNVLRVSMVKIKKDEEEECNLMCEEETLASEGNSNPGLDSPHKKVYTFSSDYKRFENLMYENLITALQKTSG